MVLYFPFGPWTSPCSVPIQCAHTITVFSTSFRVMDRYISTRQMFFMKNHWHFCSWLTVQSNKVIMLKHFNHLLLDITGTRCSHSKQRKLVNTVTEGAELHVIYQKIQVDKKSGFSAITSMLSLLIIHNLNTIACPVRDLRARLAGIIVLRGESGPSRGLVDSCSADTQNYHGPLSTPQRPLR